MAEHSALWELVSALDTARFRASRGAISFRQFVVLTVRSKERYARDDLHAEPATTAATPQWPDRGIGHR
jgi:hypothetical protein